MRRTDLQSRRTKAAPRSALRVALSAVSVLAVSTLASTAFAQDSASKPGQPTASNPAVSLNTGFVGLSPSLSGAMIDLPADAVGSTLFKLDLRDETCLSGASTCNRRGSDKLDVIYNKPFKGVSALGMDLTLTPTASVSFDDDSSSALVGALVRIGDDLREGSNLKSNTWYMFAGADAEAVTYSPNSVSRLTSGNFHLQDRIIVGDAQAGIGYRIGDADVSLGYFRREVSSFSSNDPSDDFSKREDAAALSFTWRR